MGKLEDQIKAHVLQELFAQSIDMYTAIENRFALTPAQHDAIIAHLNASHTQLTALLKDAKLA